MHQAKSGRCRFVETFWEALRGLVERGILVEVKHVEAHSTNKEKKDMSHFEKFVSLKAIEKADELAKAGAMLDEGFMAEATAETMQQEREEVYAALQCAACFPLLHRTMEGL